MLMRLDSHFLARAVLSFFLFQHILVGVYHGPFIMPWLFYYLYLLLLIYCYSRHTYHYLYFCCSTVIVDILIIIYTYFC